MWVHSRESANRFPFAEPRRPKPLPPMHHSERSAAESRNPLYFTQPAMPPPYPEPRHFDRAQKPVSLLSPRSRRSPPKHCQPPPPPRNPPQPKQTKPLTPPPQVAD